MVRHARGTGESEFRRYLSLCVGVLVWFVIIVNAWFLWPTSLGGRTTLVIVSGESMEPTYYSGDLVIARRDTPEVGDVIVYEPPGLNGARVVHRIIDGDGALGWVLQGDNNALPDPWQPTDDAVVGVVKVHYPNVGTIAAFVISPWMWVFVLSLAVIVIVWPDREDDDQPPPRYMVPAGSAPRPRGAAPRWTSKGAAS